MYYDIYDLKTRKQMLEDHEIDALVCFFQFLSYLVCAMVFWAEIGFIALVVEIHKWIFCYFSFSKSLVPELSKFILIINREML